MNTTNQEQSCGCGSCPDMVIAVFGSSLMWFSMYNVIQVLNAKRSPEWNCRIVAAFHGTASAFLCFISIFISGPWPPSYIGYPPTPLHCSIVVFSFGYFLFDFLWCLYMGTEGIVMLIHHMLSMYGYFHMIYLNLYGSEITAILGASEYTNPILQFRWFTKQLGYYRGSLAVFIDWTFVFFFVCARCIVGSIYFVLVTLSPRVDVIAKTGGAMMYCVGLVFSYNLGIFISRKYIKKKPTVHD